MECSPSDKPDAVHPSTQCNGFDNKAAEVADSDGGVGSNTRSSDEDCVPKFHVLDEVENDESDVISSDSDSDIPYDEIERMLEEALVDQTKAAEGKCVVLLLEKVLIILSQMAALRIYTMSVQRSF